MFSIKGPGLKIFAGILAAIAFLFGTYSTFFQSAGYKNATATIISIEEDPDYIPDPNLSNDVQYITTVQYTVDGTVYTNALDSYDPSYKVGGTVSIKYDPKNPAKLTSGFGFGVYLMIMGGAILLLIVYLTAKQKSSVKELHAENGEITYAPSEKGEERELYFLTDLGTPKFGHRIEDAACNVLYEAKMTKFSLLSPFAFDFIDREHGKTTPHLIGHTEETDWNSILIDNNYTFTLDGTDVWKHLRSIGITIDSRFGNGNGIFPSYTIRKDGEDLANVVATSQYVREEDAEQHKIASKIPVQGFYRFHTNQKNLDLVFMVLVAMARSGATDERGGTRRMLWNTMPDK